MSAVLTLVEAPNDSESGERLHREFLFGDDPTKRSKTTNAYADAHRSAKLVSRYAKALFESKKVMLTNWVYWKGQASHYIVATIPRK